MSLTPNLSEIQQAILDLIRERLASEGMPPSQSEIAQAFGFSGVRAAQYHLEALEQAGAIQRVPGKARGIRLVQAPVEEIDASSGRIGADSANDDALRLPVLGRV